MKKILFAASVFHHLSSFHKPFMSSFQERGFEVHAIGSNSMGRKDELLEMGIVCHEVSFIKSPFAIENIKTNKVLDRLFGNYYFDLIHVHTPIAAFLTRSAASKHKQGKILYTAHGFHFFEGAPLKNWLLYYSAEKVAMKWTDGLIIMNQEDYQLGQKMGFKKNESLHKVHGVGVDLTEFRSVTVKNKNDLRYELGIGDKSLIVSCIAELSRRKNQEFLLNNWDVIVAQCPNAHLVFIGNGETKPRLKKLIKKRKIRNVHFLGFRKDITTLISSSDIVTLVSKHEGLPRCLMEAMACGKAIVTTNVRGSRDLVEHGSNGKVVKLGDDKSLRQGFIELLQNEQLRQDYGERGKVKIQQYSLNNVLLEMSEIYARYL